MQSTRVLPIVALVISLATAVVVVITLIDAIDSEGGWDGFSAALAVWLVGPAYHGALVLLAAAGVNWLARR